jgi:hypothetical protein
MDVRDAVEADAGRMADLTDAPTDVMRNLVHDRTVRVAANGDEELVGFVSYDAENGIVHVTQIEGEPSACERLLEEPIRFARAETMPVELLVAEDDERLHEVVEAAGFGNHGPGPTFDGTPTVRYRFDP